MPEHPSISLHAPTPADAADIVAAVRESVAELEPWMDWCTAGYSLDDALAWIASTVEGREPGSAFEFVIRAPGGTVLGACGLNSVDRVNRFANLGYWVRTSQTGRGVATTAVLALAEWAFGETDLERLEIVVAVSNARSRRVAEKVGARYEGVLRRGLRVHGLLSDAVMYSIVRS